MSVIDTIPHAADTVAKLQDTLPELEAAMSYSLSDAIREGSSVTGQKIGDWHDAEGNVCALTAAALALRARRML